MYSTKALTAKLVERLVVVSHFIHIIIATYQRVNDLSIIINCVVVRLRLNVGADCAKVCRSRLFLWSLKVKYALITDRFNFNLTDLWAFVAIYWHPSTSAGSVCLDLNFRLKLVFFAVKYHDI